MKALVSKTNTVPAGGDYPYGDLKDNPGDNSGTPVNRELLGDIQRTVEKIMDEAGITANGLDDNEANGYQIYEAMKSLFRPYKVISGILKSTEFVVFENNSGETVTWSNPSSQVFRLTISGGIDASKTAVLIQPFSSFNASASTELRPSVSSGFVDFSNFKLFAPSGGGEVLAQTGTFYPAAGIFVEIRLYD